MPGERGLEELLHQPHALDHLLEIVLLGVVERALEVVHHGQEVLEDLLVAELRRVFLFLGRTLLEIVELGRAAQQPLVRVLEPLAGIPPALE